MTPTTSLLLYVLFALSTFIVVQQKEDFVAALFLGVFWPFAWAVAITRRVLYP